MTKIGDEPVKNQAWLRNGLFEVLGVDQCKNVVGPFFNERFSEVVDGVKVQIERLTIDVSDAGELFDGNVTIPRVLALRFEKPP